MARILSLLALSLSGAAYASPAPDTNNALYIDTTAASTACKKIASVISSSSAVIYPLQKGYLQDLNHWFISSTQHATCVVEIGQAADAAKALEIVGSGRVPFCVKSGGHASNPGFSSTTGVQISFERMTQVQLSNDQSTVEIGMGQTWSTVFEQLQGSGVNVVGGRVSGPGVGGFTLGGGYSWKTNQYGLTSDNVKSYNLALPNGTLTTVTAADTDLFYALKGGLNRFGIVTSAEYYTHPQVPLIYGGIADYGPGQTEAILKATQNFNQHNTDPRAQVITTLSGSATGTSALVLFFYDGPNEPATFKPFLQLPALLKTVKQQSFASFVSGVPSTIVEATNVRGRFNSLNTKTLTPAFLAAVKNQSDYYGKVGVLHGSTTISYDIEPFLNTYGRHDVAGAYPHADSPLPLNIYFAWTLAAEDDFWIQAIKDTTAVLTATAKAEGILGTTALAYPNYALAGTAINNMYGASNAARLHVIRAQVDPHNVMGLTGGFAI